MSNFGSINKVMLLGNLGQDPEIRAVRNGEGRVANLSLATTSGWTDKSTGEWHEKVEWHRVVVWNEHIVKLVEKFCKKGTMICVEGALQTRKWQDQSGADRYSTEVVLQGIKCDLQILRGQRGKNDSDDREERAAPRQSTGRPLTRDLDDEIPF